MAAQDKNREFKVTELQLGSNGKFNETAVKFVWDRQHFSAPRGPWEFTRKTRTVREDYPGNNVPTEQVLGSMYDPFNLEGVWDDRYNYIGYAALTWEQFDQMVARGNPVRVDFENISFSGIITDFKTTYRRQWQIGWSFKLSPHVRNSSNQASRPLVPKAIANPNSYATTARAIVTEAVSYHTVVAPAAAVSGTLYRDVGSKLAEWSNRMDTVDSIVQNRVLFLSTPTSVTAALPGQNSPITVTPPGSDIPLNTMSRLAQAFGAMKNSAQDLLNLTATASTATGLFYEAAIPNLSFETWTRLMNVQARALIVAADTALDDLNRRVQPSALALYRPQSGESLYGISNRFYGTPTKWRDIAERNQLKTWTMAGTELLVIPKQAVSNK